MTDIVAAIARMQARHASIPPTSPKRPEPKPEPAKPAAYRALLNATDGIVRQVAELHQPVPEYVRQDGSVSWWECRGCEASGYDWEYPNWPCGTTGLIAEQVGVSLREDDYTVDATQIDFRGVVGESNADQPQSTAINGDERARQGR